MVMLGRCDGDVVAPALVFWSFLGSCSSFGAPAPSLSSVLASFSLVTAVCWLSCVWVVWLLEWGNYSLCGHLWASGAGLGSAVDAVNCKRPAFSAALAL